MRNCFPSVALCWAERGRVREIEREREKERSRDRERGRETNTV